MNYRSALTLSAAILLVGCGVATQPSTEEEPIVDDVSHPTMEQEDQSGATVVRETKNVTYEGIVRPAGISIYQEGSHRLQLDDGRFILLESDSSDLNGYVGERVEVFGALRPTVEDGSMIIRVEAISLIVDEDAEDTTLDEETTSTGETVVEEEEEEPANEDEEVEEVEEEEVPADETVEEDTDEEAEEPEAVIPATSPELTERIDQMAAEDFSADQWTQQYCTAHIGFCVPVHRNWWFKSFGTTTSILWHVEMSSQEIDHLFDGPIRVNLISGTVGAKKAADGQIREEPDGSVVGYRSWTDNRHFEISAPAELSEAVKYITKQLEEYVGE